MEKKKKPIGYTASDRKSLKTLIERTQPNVGDYVGSGTVTTVKKPVVKKPVKKMAMGGIAGAPANMPNNANARGLGQQARALAQAPNRTGGIGQQMSALAKRPAAPAQTMKKGGMVMRGAGAATRGKKISSKMG